MRRVLLLLLTLLLLGGCADYHELEELMTVTGAAIDLAGEEVLLTAEVLRAEAAQSGEGTPTVTCTVRAPTVSGCAEELGRYLGGKVYWGHAELLVFSRAALEQRFSEVLDWVLRDNEVRLTAVFALSAAETAAELFSVETDAFSAGETLVRILKSSTVPDAAGQGAAFRLKNKLLGGEWAMLPLLGLAEAADYRAGGGKDEPGPGSVFRAVPAGAVLLRGDREDPTRVSSAALLNARQAQLLMLSRGECGETGCVLESEDWTVAVERVTAKRGEGTLTIDGRCSISRYAGGGRNHLTPEETRRCAEAAAVLLAEELSDALLAAAPALGEPPALRVTLIPRSTGLISG